MFYLKLKKTNMIGLIILVIFAFFISACGNDSSSKSANSSVVTKDSIIQYFSKDLGFKFQQGVMVLEYK